MNLAIATTFFDSLSNFDQKKQKEILKYLQNFSKNFGKLDYHAIKNSGNPKKYSAHLNNSDNDRAIFINMDGQKDTKVLLWVDSHKKAYDWAMNKRIEISEILQNIQIINSENIDNERKVEEIVSPNIQFSRSKNDESKFHNISDEMLLNIGVAQVKISKLRYVYSTEQLFSIENDFSQETFEALFSIAEGNDPHSEVNEYLQKIGIKKAFDIHYEKLYDGLHQTIIENHNEKSRKKDLEILKQQADDDNPHAQYHLAKCLFNLDSEKNIDKVFHYYEKAAKEGHANAQYELGKLIFETDDRESYDSLNWLEKSAAQKHPRANYLLGKCYLNGIGVKQDDNIAFKLLSKASDSKVYEATYLLASIHMEKSDDRSSMEKAYQYLKLCAEKEMSHAQYILGKWYEDGKFIEISLEESRKWYEKAAKNGEKRSQYRLGKFYSESQKKYRDLEKAVYWYKKSAIQGYSKAQFELGNIFSQKNSPIYNKLSSLYWYQESLIHGHSIPHGVLSEISDFSNVSSLPAITEVSGTRYIANLNQLGLRIGQKLNLLRKQDNKFDTNAIRVTTFDLEEIGWVPKEVNFRYAQDLDKGESYHAEIVDLIPNKEVQLKIVIKISKIA